MRLNPESVARASSRHPWRTISVWLALIVAMGAVSSTLLGGVLSQDVAFTNEPESLKAQEVIDRAFPESQQGNDTVFFIVGSTAVTTANPAFRQRILEVQAAIADLGDEVVAGPSGSFLDLEAQARELFTPDYHSTLIALDVTGSADDDLARIQDVAAAGAPTGFEARVASAGGLPLTIAAMQASDAPSEPVEGSRVFVVVSSERASVSNATFASATGAIEQAVVEGAGDLLATQPVSGFDVRAQAESLVSPDGHYALISVPLADSSDAVIEGVRASASRLSTNGYEVQVGGDPTLAADFTKIAEQDMRQSEGLGLVVALIVLIVVFGSLVAAFLPIVMGMCAIGLALGLVALVGQLVDFNLFVENMVTMIGLAVGIDYSLFIVSRYREERKKGFDKLEAIGRSGATANRAVFFSGITVVLALMGMLIIPVSIFRSLAGGAIFVTLAAIAAAISLLPAVLALLGDRINWPRLSKRARLDATHDLKGGFWDRVSRGVMARPVFFLLASVLVLGGLGAFYFQLHRGTSQNVSQLPDSFESKQAFLTLTAEFAGGTTQPVKIVLSGDVRSPETRGAVEALREGIANDPAFAPETMLTPATDGETLLVSAFVRGDPSSDQAFQAIRDLRSTIVPSAFDDVPGVEILVGGGTAFFTDFLTVADRYQWIVLAFVLTLSFVLLTVVFRSIVVPLKAIVMNLLSVGAAYGAVVLVFQKGVGIDQINDLFGFRLVRAEAIEAWLPLFLFSVLFGLSMDYHVFLLTRIREEYDKTGDNTEAVAYGLRTTAGIITGAAAIMVAVFISFASGRLGPMQQMGFGLAVAVFLDATIVRTLLVPASMRLLGDINWYLPRWLEWLPQLHVEGREEPIRIPATDATEPLVPSRG